MRRTRSGAAGRRADSSRPFQPKCRLQPPPDYSTAYATAPRSSPRLVEIVLCSHPLVGLARMLDAIFKLAKSDGKFGCDAIRALGRIKPTRRMVLDRLADPELVLAHFDFCDRCRMSVDRDRTYNAAAVALFLAVPIYRSDSPMLVSMGACSAQTGGRDLGGIMCEKACGVADEILVNGFLDDGRTVVREQSINAGILPECIAIVGAASEVYQRTSPSDRRAMPANGGVWRARAPRYISAPDRD